MNIGRTLEDDSLVARCLTLNSNPIDNSYDQSTTKIKRSHLVNQCNEHIINLLICEDPNPLPIGPRLGLDDTPPGADECYKF